MKYPFEKLCIVLILLALFGYLYTQFKPSLLLPMHDYYYDYPGALLQESFDERSGGNERSEENDLDAGQEGLTATSIQSLTAANQGLALSQYMIKGAYNAAFDGTSMTDAQLKTVLENGCRFIDLEVHAMNISGAVTPVLITTTDGKSTTGKPYYLTDALTTLVNTGFASSLSNSKDPLFLHLRIITGSIVNHNDLYCNCAKIINTKLGSLLYNGNIVTSTPMASLMGHVVLCVDKSLIPDYKSYPTCSGCESVAASSSPSPSPSASASTSGACPTLKQLVSAETGGFTWTTMNYGSVVGIPPANCNADDGGVLMPQNNLPVMQLVVPPSTLKQKNPSPKDMYRFVSMSTCQTVLFMYYQTDTGANELSFYESIFTNSSSAIVPMCYAITYITNNWNKFRGNQAANY